MIVEPEGVFSDLEDEADYVIVGTGAAGATAAWVLARSGASVILVEEGPCFRPSQLGQGMVTAFTRLFRDLGAQVTRGPAQIPLLQASCVGGSTVINSGIMWRTPDAVLDTWAREFGLAPMLDRVALDACFAELEKELSIKPTDEAALGGNGRVLADGAQVLGWRAQPTHRSERACEGSSRCLEGCTRARRQSMNHTFIPRAIAAGARLYAQCKVERVALQRGEARLVMGRFAPAEPGGPRYRLLARARRAIILGASAIHTPPLIQRSGLNATGQVGLHFQGHPGVAMIGLFDKPVRMWTGASQSYEITEFGSKGIKIESLNLPPEMLGVRLPGVGRGLMRHLSNLDGVALAAIPIKARAQGTVHASALGWGGGGVTVRYAPEPADVQMALEGLTRTAQAYFAAGACAVLPGVHGVPETIENRRDLAALRSATADPQSFSWVMTHLMGTARMGPSPGTSAVDLTGQVHHVPGLYVLDSSIFPTNLGVNPQHSIMGMAMLLAQRLAGLRAPPEAD